MRLTFVGCGDAFGAGGRAHTCLRLDGPAGTVVVDFGAGSISAWKKLGFDTKDIDAVIVSHLHGDHFCGLPFLLLECQYVAGRTTPLRLIGPPGFRARLEAAMEVMFPGATATRWRFDWRVEEIAPGGSLALEGLRLTTIEVTHPAGAPSTAIRLEGGGRAFAYSGDTAWTENLPALAQGCDLFVCECHSAKATGSAHLDWESLRPRLAQFGARRIALTHLGDSALARRSEMEEAGCIVAEDGLAIDF